jgi:hypothetical protein
MQPTVSIVGGNINPYILPGATDEQRLFCGLLMTSGPAITSAYNHVSNVGGPSGFLWRYQGLRGVYPVFDGVEIGTYIKRCSTYPPSFTLATKQGSKLNLYADMEVLDRIIDAVAQGDCYGIN